MTGGDQIGGRSVVTIVLRMRRSRSFNDRAALNFQITHVQTGEVAYFKTLESVSQHVERVAHAFAEPFIDLIEFRQRSDNV